MIRYKKYDSKEEYFDHQSSKLGNNKALEKEGSSIRWRDEFIDEFSPIVSLLKKGPVLCLGARRGAEVAAWNKLGFLCSVGIDVNPGPQNEDTFGDLSLVGAVKEGDFHNIPFEGSSFDTIYCNCIDHCQDIDKVFSEMSRVLKENGCVVLRFSRQNLSGGFESCFWDSPEDIVDVVEANGFEVLYHAPTNYRMHADRENEIVARRV